MENKKDTQKGGSHDKSTMGNRPDREFEGQGQNPGKGTQGQQAGQSKGNFEDDDMTTSGGRQGQTSDRGSSGGGQWSPGSSQESDR